MRGGGGGGGSKSNQIIFLTETQLLSQSLMSLH